MPRNIIYINLADGNIQVPIVPQEYAFLYGVNTPRTAAPASDTYSRSITDRRLIIAAQEFENGMLTFFEEMMGRNGFSQGMYIIAPISFITGTAYNLRQGETLPNAMTKNGISIVLHAMLPLPLKGVLMASHLSRLIEIPNNAAPRTTLAMFCLNPMSILLDPTTIIRAIQAPSRAMDFAINAGNRLLNAAHRTTLPVFCPNPINILLDPNIMIRTIQAPSRAAIDFVIDTGSGLLTKAKNYPFSNIPLSQDSLSPGPLSTSALPAILFDQRMRLFPESTLQGLIAVHAIHKQIFGEALTLTTFQTQLTRTLTGPLATINPVAFITESIKSKSAFEINPFMRSLKKLTSQIHLDNSGRIEIQVKSDGSFKIKIGIQDVTADRIYHSIQLPGSGAIPGQSHNTDIGFQHKEIGTSFNFGTQQNSEDPFSSQLPFEFSSRLILGSDTANEKPSPFLPMEEPGSNSNIPSSQGEIITDDSVPTDEAIINFAQNIDAALLHQGATGTNHGLSKIFREVDCRPNELQSAPQIPSSLMPQEINHCGISLVENTSEMLLFRVDTNSAILSPGFHSFLTELNQIGSISVQQPLELNLATIPQVSLLKSKHFSKTESKASKAKQPKVKEPLITDIKIGVVGSSIGVIATLAGKGIVSFTAGKGGFFISVSANFSPGFWTALGISTGVGAVIAGVMITAQYFYKKHIKHIQNKLTSAIDHTKKDAKFISETLSSFSQKLQSESSINLSQLISEMQVLISHITQKIYTEEERAEYAKRHKNLEASNVHSSISRDYQSSVQDLSKLKKSLELNQVQTKFVEANQEKTSKEIISIAKELTSKTSYNDEDIANIKGLRQLIVNKVLQLSQSGKTDEAQALLKETFNLSYHLPGNIVALVFDISMGKVDKNTQGDINTINRELDSINQLIGSGENPIGTLQGLITHISSVLDNWEKRKSDRRKSSIPVSRQQWKERIRILKDLTTKLQSQIKKYEGGNQAANLKLDGLCSFLQQLSNHSDKSTSFWFDKIKDFNSGKKLYSEEESILFKAISSHHLINSAVTIASQGNFEDAKHIMSDLMELMPEYKELSEQYNAKLDELEPFIKEDATFWLNRIKLINTVAKEKRKESDGLEFVIAEQFTLNDVFSHAAQGKFGKAKKILEQFKITIPDQEETAIILLTKIEELQPHYQDADYCMRILKDSSEKPEGERGIDDILKYAIANQVVMSDIFSKSIEGEFSKAKDRCDEYLESMPDKIEKIKEYKAGIEELEALKGKGNKNLLDRYAFLCQTESSERTGKEDILVSGIHAWILQNVYELVSKGNPAEAIDDLHTLKRKDPRQSELYNKLTSVINYGQENSDQNEAFWHEEYKKHLQTQSELQSTEYEDLDPHAVAVSKMGETVAVKACLDIASEHSQLGFNRKARDVIKRLRNTNSNLELKNIEDDFDFTHKGQLLSVFTRPLQAVLVNHARSYQPSKLRSLALGGLELINTVQVVMPNALALSAQAAHAKCVIGDMCVVKRNTDNVLTQLSKDLNPFNKDFNPFNKETYCNGAMIYGQLLLKAAQHFPLKWVVSEQNLLSAESTRSTAVQYGHLAVHSVITGTAALQLKAARSLKGGMFSLASTPTLLVTLANPVVELGYWGYHKYKDSRGESIEDPNHYLVQKGVGSGIETIGSTAFAVLITGGLGWLALSAAAVIGGAGIHNIRCDSTRQDTTARALVSAIKNIGYYQNLKTTKQYINDCRYKLIQREANEQDINKVKARSEIILASVHGGYYIYYASEEHNAYHKEKLYGQNAFLKELDWPSTNHSGIFLDEGYAHYMMCSIGYPDCNELEKGMYFYRNDDKDTIRVLVVHGDGKVDSPDLLAYFKDNEVEFKLTGGEPTDKFRPVSIPAQLNKFILAKYLKEIKKITENRMISTPIIGEYTSICEYRIQFGRPNAQTLDKIRSGKEICFTKEISNTVSTFYIYIKGRNGQVEKIQIVNFPHFLEDIEEQVVPYYISPKSRHYIEVYEYATKSLIDHYLVASRNSIEILLRRVFNGLTYNEDQSEEVINTARLVHLHQKVKYFYDLKNYKAVISWSNKFDRAGNIVITQLYQIPPHLAWQILVGLRFLVYAESNDLLLQFREQFQEYSKYIYDSANKSKPWYHANWTDVQKSMEQILRFALQQFIVAADRAETKKEKIKYLSLVTKQYNYSKEWHRLLKNDELKFWAAHIYHSLGKKKDCALFLRHIPNLPLLIKNKRQADFTEHALLMLEDIDATQHRKLLLQEQRDAYAIQDTMLLNSVFKLLAAQKYNEANRILQGSKDFQGKQTALAAYTFESTNQTHLLEALKQLTQDNNKTLAYWQLLYDILKKCLFSTKYSPSQGYQIHANAMLFGLIKICIDYIQTFNIIPWALKIETDSMINKAMSYIKNFIRVTYPQIESDDELNVEIDKLVQKGHKCIRGESGLSIITKIENILTGISYEYVDEKLKTKYMPLEVPADGDCAFHVFGISRKKGIDLLLNHVKSQCWISKAFYGNTQRKDVINLILDDLEIARNTIYDRSEACFPENVTAVKEYLELLSKAKTWMPYNQKAPSVLDALALLLEKNLRIFVTNSEGQLVLTSSNTNDEAFATVDMLCTSANGFSHNEREFNHYVKLAKLPTQVVEMVDSPLIERQQQPKTLFFKYNPPPPTKPSKSSLSSENHAVELDEISVCSI